MEQPSNPDPHPTSAAGGQQQHQNLEQKSQELQQGRDQQQQPEQGQAAKEEEEEVDASQITARLHELLKDADLNTLTGMRRSTYPVYSALLSWTQRVCLELSWKPYLAPPSRPANAERQVRKQLEKDLGVDLSTRKELIKREVRDGPSAA